MFQIKLFVFFPKTVLEFNIFFFVINIKLKNSLVKIVLIKCFALVAAGVITLNEFHFHETVNYCLNPCLD